jgi:hypothetical protein
MKKLYLLIAFIVTIATFAQAPQGFNYQATVRNSSGALIVNQNVNFKFNVMLNSQTSVPVYSETHYVPTDDLGAVNLVIGQGTSSTGTFSNINWGTGNYYMGIELNTGNGYVAMGTTQLLSVPYALYANSAGSATTNSGGFSHYVGEFFGGGIIYSLWKDNTGAEHGLIVDLNYLSNSQIWSNIDNPIGTSAQSNWDGLSNSNAIVAQAGHISSAAALCLNSVNGRQNDWYLPSIDELNLLWNNAFIVNKGLSTITGATQLSPKVYNWSSTEYQNTDEFGNNNFGAWCKFYIYSGGGATSGKSYNYYVRAIRQF